MFMHGDIFYRFHSSVTDVHTDAYCHRLKMHYQYCMEIKQPSNSQWQGKTLCLHAVDQLLTSS